MLAERYMEGKNFRENARSKRKCNVMKLVTAFLLGEHIQAEAIDYLGERYIDGCEMDKSNAYTRNHQLLPAPHNPITRSSIMAFTTAPSLSPARRKSVRIPMILAPVGFPRKSSRFSKPFCHQPERHRSMNPVKKPTVCNGNRSQRRSIC